MVSKKENPRGQKFSKAKDRFNLPKDRVNNPSPLEYSPRSDTKSVFKTNARVVIGRQNIDILDLTYNKKE